jgi:aryl-alcohol dehydrogenase-like predicted oxidoreductase
MRYNRAARTGLELSEIGLGGHEFLPDGRSRGFNEDYGRATTPGVLFPGFGGDKRRGVVAAAHAAGINFFDVTIDSEKEALARNFKEIPPPREVYVQTRPEGMVYTNNPDDKHNWRMAKADLFRAEVERLSGVLGRRPDFLNMGFMVSALENDPDYLKKIAANVAALKARGLIRFACADTFSGEAFYLKQIETGAFDGIFINFNLADDGPARRVLPEAAARGLSVHCREAFGKGALFKMGEEAGIADRSLLARVAIRWVLSHREVTTCVIGADSAAELADDLKALGVPPLSAEDDRVIVKLKQTRIYRDVHAEKLASFGVS